jgi:hypothetical protein
MSTKGFIEKITYILFGFAIALGFLLLTGADKAVQVGRYQISTEVRRDFVDVYVIDTATGAVKYVDSNNENKPFEEVKSR